MRWLVVVVAIVFSSLSSASSHVFEQDFINRFAVQVAENQPPDLSGLVGTVEKRGARFSSESGDFSVFHTGKDGSWLALVFELATDISPNIKGSYSSTSRWFRSDADLDAAVTIFDIWADSKIDQSAASNASNCLTEIPDDATKRVYGRAVAFLNDDGTMRGFVRLEVMATALSYLDSSRGHSLQLTAQAAVGNIRCGSPS